MWDYCVKHSIQHVPLTINNMEVEIADLYRYLGLLVDNKFSFADHVESQIKKANKCITSQ